MDISQIPITALSLVPAGLAVGVGNKGFEWFKEIVQRRQKDHKAGRGCALELWELLIRFARECNEQACYNLDQHAGYVKIPVLPNYPDGIAWTVLPPKVAAGLLALRVEIDEARSGIRWVGEMIDPIEAVDTATGSYVTLGNMALGLSHDLARYYRFGSYPSANGYHFTRNLRRLGRQNHRGLLRRAWGSLSVYRARRYVRRLTKRFVNSLWRPVISESGPVTGK
jgi:hypothetical protein